MAKQVKTSKYSLSMEAQIRDSAPMNQAKAEVLASEFGKDFSARSVIAKTIRMGVKYNRKQPVSKTGSPVEQKAAIVAEIADLTGANLEGLDKAPKGVLQALRDYLAA